MMGSLANFLSFTRNNVPTMRLKTKKLMTVAEDHRKTTSPESRASSTIKTEPPTTEPPAQSIFLSPATIVAPGIATFKKKGSMAKAVLPIGTDTDRTINVSAVF